MISYCGYCQTDKAIPLDVSYHDHEWGIPVHDDTKMFEYLTLEVMQCGLSWTLMLKKREVFRQCFDNFDFYKISTYTEDDVQRILDAPEMIRSRRKIEAIIGNAKCAVIICEEFGSLCEYFWQFSDHKTILYNGHNTDWIPVSNALSDKLSRDLKNVDSNIWVRL